MDGADGINGMVIRVARHDIWADVAWWQSSTGKMWSKRQPDRSKLRVTWRDGHRVDGQ
jgi:hypothetical protein